MANLFDQADGADGGQLLKEQLQLVKVANGDNVAARYQVRPLSRKLGFDKGFYVCMRALQLLMQHNRGCIIVGVAGASGSGKTTFTTRLRNMMQSVLVLSMDMYNDGAKVLENNFDDPRIADYDTLLANINDLRAGRKTKVPIYDFKQSKRVGYEEVSVPESKVIIIEGIYALSQRLAPLLDLRISIEGGIHFDLVKRVMRDIQRSGQCAGEVIQQISDTVYPMYKAFIEPDLQSAHIKITNNFNPFAGFKEPIQILKTQDSVSVEAVKDALHEMYPDSPVRQEEEVEVHDIFLLPPGEDPQGCTSWLRMRNKEGKYSLMFAEYVVNEPFIVSPRVSFEVPVRILGGLMALGYTIGSIMSRISYRVCCQEIRVKWDRIDKLGCFVQVQGEKRDPCKALADKVGIKTFIPRSYIEQVQLLQLTEQFAEITDKARAHFTMGDDNIIDDHVIGGSPARKLKFVNRGNSLRHSIGTSNAASLPEPSRLQSSSKPLQTKMGWPDATQGAECASHNSGSQPRDSAALNGQQAPLMMRSSRRGSAKPSQLSLEMEALSLERRGSGAVADPDVASASGGPSNGEMLAKASKGVVTSSGPCVSDTAAKRKLVQAGAATGAQRKGKASSVPWFWEAKNGESEAASVLETMGADVRRLTDEVVHLTEQLKLSTLAIATTAGFAAGVGVTALAMMAMLPRRGS